MKKRIIKTVINLGLISSTIFMSCAKKSDDPKPDSKVETKEQPIKIKCDTCANNKMYVFENDTALTFIEKWNGKVIKCISTNPQRSNDSISITISKVISSGFSVEYNNHYILRVKWVGKETGEQTVDYLAFKNNKFIQRIPELNTHINPWLIEPLESYFDLQIISDNKLWFNMRGGLGNVGEFNILN